MVSSSFIQKLKAFNISNAWQLVSVYCSHVESSENFKINYKTKKEKVRNQTTCITKFSTKKKKMKERKKEREGDGQTDREEEEKKDQQKKKEGDGQTNRE